MMSRICTCAALTVTVVPLLPPQPTSITCEVRRRTRWARQPSGRAGGRGNASTARQRRWPARPPWCRSVPLCLRSPCLSAVRPVQLPFCPPHRRAMPPPAPAACRAARAPRRPPPRTHPQLGHVGVRLELILSGRGAHHPLPLRGAVHLRASMRAGGVDNGPAPAGGLPRAPSAPALRQGARGGTPGCLGPGARVMCASGTSAWPPR